MSLRDAITRSAHRAYCGTDRQPAPDWGCVGCGGPTADVYLTVGCERCQAPGESYCWGCIDEWASDPDQVVPVPPYTVHPGRDR